MDLILRKKESSTSQILFIYNAFLWDKGMKRAPLTGLLNVLGHFGKSKTSLRMALSRAVHNGFFINEKIGGEVYYSLTESGVSAIEGWRRQIGDYFKRSKLQHQWDGKWFMVNFNIPVELEGKRLNFVRFLQENKFATLNKGVWISPYDYRHEINQYCLEAGIRDFVITFQSELIEEERKDIFITQLWNIEKAQHITTNFIDDFNPYLQTLDEGPMEKENSLDSLLPLLHEIGWRFMEIVQFDHQLPFELYSNNPSSAEAVLLFSNLRNAVLHCVQEYTNKELDSNIKE